jgi:hypothetical protein
MKRSPRFLTSLVMTAVYLLVVLAPLAPAALHSPFIAHALTGECSGDCRSCGCAPERSAARACCCWQKKLAREPVRAVKAGKTCCAQHTSPEPLAEAVTSANRHECDSDHEKHAAASTAENPASASDRPLPVLSIRPCGSDGHIALQGVENTQHFPYVHAINIPVSLPLPHSPISPDRLFSRHGEPPDPPPEIAAFS